MLILVCDKIIDVALLPYAKKVRLLYSKASFEHSSMSSWGGSTEPDDKDTTIKNMIVRALTRYSYARTAQAQAAQQAELGCNCLLHTC